MNSWYHHFVQSHGWGRVIYNDHIPIALPLTWHVQRNYRHIAILFCTGTPGQTVVHKLGGLCVLYATHYIQEHLILSVNT